MPTTVIGNQFFTETGNVTFGLAGNTVSATAAAGGGAAQTLALWRNQIFGSSTKASSHSTLAVVPLNFSNVFPGVMTANTMLFDMSCNASQSQSTGRVTFSFGLYTLTGSTLSLLNSATTAAPAFSSSTAASTQFSGARWLTVHSSLWSAQPVFSQTHYWLAYAASFNSTNRTQGLQFVGLALGLANNNLAGGGLGGFFGTMGVSSTTSNSTCLPIPFYGYYSTSTNGIPASIISNQVVLNASAPPVSPNIVFNNVNASF